MGDGKRIASMGTFTVLLVAWLGFLVHREPRFAGSAVGAAFGIAGALLMLAPLAYVAVKRLSKLRALVTPRVPLRALLEWHVYAGLVGPILALIHTGHRFDSVLGVALTAAMLALVVSGAVGYYLYTYASKELHERRSMLVRLRMALERARAELEPGALAGAGALSLLAAGAVRSDAPPLRVLRIAGAMADVELAIRARTSFERWLRRWLWLHVALSVVFYALLALHVWAGIYYGLRWLR